MNFTSSINEQKSVISKMIENPCLSVKNEFPHEVIFFSLKPASYHISLQRKFYTFPKRRDFSILKNVAYF